MRKVSPCPLTNPGKCAKLSVTKAVRKTCPTGKIPREGAVLLQGSCNPAGVDTTSEPWVGNGPPVAPVNAPMSGGGIAATRVEPWNDLFIPPLHVQGVGIFYTFPKFKSFSWRYFYGKREPVHL